MKGSLRIQASVPDRLKPVALPMRSLIDRIEPVQRGPRA
jgi:hypothetical protein